MNSKIGPQPGRRFQRPLKGGFVGVLDVGSTKVACLIARAVRPREGGEPFLSVMGVGQQASMGVRAGNVIDIAATEQAIRAAVEQAERMAGVMLRDLVVGVSCGQVQSRTINVELSIGGREVYEDDLNRAYALGQAKFPPQEREVLHCLPGSYSIDGDRGIRNPIGMIGDTLGVSMHVVSALAGPLRNLESCIGRCNLSVSGKVASSFASGLATLVPDEMELGATVIDMGGGSTTVSVFFDGTLIFADVLPVGGNHVTSDIARGLSTPLTQAERLKTLHGSALSGPNDAREMVPIRHLGDDESDGESQVERSVLTGIIQARVEETFELVRDRLADCGLSSISARRVVLTGGASQLNGAREIAARILSKQVRLGKPVRLTGLSEMTNSAPLATCAGLAAWASHRPEEVQTNFEERDLPQLKYASGVTASGIAGIKRWFKENF